MIELEQIKKDLKDILIKEDIIDEESIVDYDKPYYNVMDSLDFVHVVMDLESKYGVQLKDTDLLKIITLDELIELTHTVVNENKRLKKL